jgi:hypothetical protein
MEESFYERLFGELYRRQVRYVLCGGQAVNLHGVPRLTADADLAVDFEEGNIGEFIRVMHQLGLRPMLPVDPADLAKPEKRAEWRSAKGSVVFQFADPSKPYFKVDVFLEHPLEFEKLWSCRKRLLFGAAEVSVASIDHLIALKELVQPPREQDLADIRALRKVQAMLNRRRRND